MKLIISGSGGTGKTTLARHISQYTGATYIPDYMDLVLKENDMETPKEMGNVSAILVRKEALKRKIEHENREENYVSDKGAIDYFAYWLIWTSNNASLEDNNEFYSKVIKHSKSIESKSVVLPFGKYNLINNKIRSTDYFHQFRVHALIKGLYGELEVAYTEYDYSFSNPINKVMSDLRL